MKGGWTPDKFTHENLIQYPYNMSPGRRKNRHDEGLTSAHPFSVPPDAMAEALRKEAGTQTSQDTEAQQAIIPAEPAANNLKACY
jgi:hypothetical protein